MLDRSYSFKLFKNILYLLMYFGSCAVSDSVFDLLADVSHLSFLTIFLLLLSIVSSLCVAVTAMHCCSASPAISSLDMFVVVVCCCCSASPVVSSLCVAVVVLVCCCSSISVSSFAIAVVVAACFCPSISATSCAPSLSSCVAAQVFPLYRLLLPPSSSCAAFKVFSDSSCAAASCLPVNLFSSPSCIRSISSCFLSGSSDVECIVYLVFVQRFCFRSLLSNPPFFGHGNRKFTATDLWSLLK